MKNFSQYILRPDSWGRGAELPGREGGVLAWREEGLWGTVGFLGIVEDRMEEGRGTIAEIGIGDAGSREDDGLELEVWWSKMLEVGTGMAC